VTEANQLHPKLSSRRKSNPFLASAMLLQKRKHGKPELGQQHRPKKVEQLREQRSELMETEMGRRLYSRIRDINTHLTRK
jgi:hypothetical protein